MQLRARQFTVIDAEPPPPGLLGRHAQSRGYLLYSARYANIYTVRHLLQLVREAFGAPPKANPVWRRGAAFFDAFRPSVEPEGLRSVDEVIAHRVKHLAAVKAVVETLDVLVFTFGLTEAWIETASGTVFPVAPGVLAGAFDQDVYNFKNFTHAEILADFCALRDEIRAVNPRARFILTVSPVPLAATASGQHVLSATTYSKAILRAVAGELETTFEDVDYFPSYELIASPLARAAYYDESLRNVTPEGVAVAMRAFFDCHDPSGSAREAQDESIEAQEALAECDDEVVCEDAILDAFAPR